MNDELRCYVRTTRFSYFTRHPLRSSGKIHASQGLATEALCHWDYLNGNSDPTRSTVPLSVPKLLAEVTCATCVIKILRAEGLV